MIVVGGDGDGGGGAALLSNYFYWTEINRNAQKETRTTRLTDPKFRNNTFLSLYNEALECYVNGVSDCRNELEHSEKFYCSVWQT